MYCFLFLHLRAAEVVSIWCTWYHVSTHIIRLTHSMLGEILSNRHAFSQGQPLYPHGRVDRLRWTGNFGKVQLQSKCKSSDNRAGIKFMRHWNWIAETRAIVTRIANVRSWIYSHGRDQKMISTDDTPSALPETLGFCFLLRRQRRLQTLLTCSWCSMFQTSF